MTKTSVVALAALLGLLAGCDASGDDTGSGTPQAVDGSAPPPTGGGGGCEESHRSNSQTWQGEHQTDTGAWQTAAQLGQQNDSGSWEPPTGTQTHAVEQSFTLNHWTVVVREIDYDATDEVLSALTERGLSYDGTPIEDWQWVVAEVELAYGGTEVASPDAELESRYVDRDGGVYIDFQCGMGNPDAELEAGQTTTVSFGVPVQPDLVDGGFWGIGLADAIGEADATDVDHLTYVR